MIHIRGARYHPQTQDKIERYHRSLKNVVNLQHYFLPSELEQEIEHFVDHYNNHRYHESLDNLMPADVYSGRRRERLNVRNIIKRETTKLRRAYNQGKGGVKKTLAVREKCTLTFNYKCPEGSDDIQTCIRNDQ